MKIDILLPTYNNESSIRNAVDSVLNQSYEDFRLIIINDGSTDKTGDIIKELSEKDHRIFVLNNPINCGIGKSLSNGFEIVKAEFTARMDGDDEWLPNKLSRQIEFIMSKPKYAVVGSAAYLRNAKGDIQIMPKSISTPNRGLSSLVNDYVYHPTVLIRTYVLRQVGGYDHTLRKSEDKDLWIRILNSGYLIGNIQEPLIYYNADHYRRSWRYVGEKIKSDAIIMLKHPSLSMLLSWIWLSTKQVARKICG